MSLNKFSFSRPTQHGLRKTVRSPSWTIIILAAFVLPALAPARAQAQRMKLLTPTTGWVANNGHLYWTRNSGGSWTDITPIPPGARRRAVGGLRGISFLNTQEGWVVIYLPTKPVSLVPQPHRPQNTLYDIAHTVDGCQSWSFVPLAYPRLPEWEQDALVGPDDMFFLDSLHGWMVMAMDGSSNFAPGKLMATDDGGRNWKWVNGPGTIGTLLFTSTQDGWLAGGPGGGNLYVTRNDGGSWGQVNLKTKLEGKTVGCGVLGLPHFTDARHGFLATSCMGQAVVAFATSDAGKTWRPSKVLKDSWEGGILHVALADSALIVPSDSSTKAIHIASANLSVKQTPPVVVSGKGVYGLTFADASHGMAQTENGVLYTSDGGATWKNVTPWPMVKPSPLPPGVTVKHPKIEIEVTHPGALRSGDHPAPPHTP